MASWRLSCSRTTASVTPAVSIYAVAIPGARGKPAEVRLYDGNGDRLVATPTIEAVRSVAGNDLLTLINDILDLSKVEAGHIELESIEFDLSDLIEKAIEILAMRANEKGLELACHLAPDVPCALTGDPNRLHQILVNLISNAIKYSPIGGKITVTIPVTEPCPTCGGNGGAPGASWSTCPECNGRGTISFGQGGFAVNRPCPQCRGRGKIPSQPCPTCRGAGDVRTERRVATSYR